MAKQPTFRDRFFTNIAPVIVGLGASVVILGALCKIQHWPNTGWVLTVGMLVEAGIFATFAFAPVPHDPAWDRVYPQLDDEYWAKMQGTQKPAVQGEQKSAVKAIDEMMNQAKIDQEMINKLGTGFKSLSESVSKMGDVAGANVATKEYAANVTKASSALVEMNKSYADTVQAMGKMANATQDAAQYHTQVQQITKNLGALNAVYEMELQDANNHLKAMNQFYSNLTTAMRNMDEAGKNTDTLRSEVQKLTGNLSSLNNVYGNMLAAMRAPAPAAPAKA